MLLIHSFAAALISLSTMCPFFAAMIIAHSPLAVRGCPQAGHHIFRHFNWDNNSGDFMSSMMGSRSGRGRGRGVPRLVAKLERRWERRSGDEDREAAGGMKRKEEVRGVSLRWFMNFCVEQGLGRMKMGDLLRIVRWKEEKPFVKEVADVYVSYPAECTVDEMMTSLKTLLISSDSASNEEKKDVFIWMDVLAMDSAELERGTKYWMKQIEAVINKIGHVAVVLTPWDNPYNLTRSWCVWELYCATLDENTEVKILISPSQRSAFRQALRSDTYGLVPRIGKMDMTKAEAFNKSDQEIMLNAARTAKGGIEAVQESVVGPIRKWMTAQAIAFIDELVVKGDDLGELAAMCTCVGELLREQGLYDVQERYSRKALELHKQLNGDDHPGVAISLNNLAELLRMQGKYEEAEPLYREALAIEIKTFGNEHAYVAIGLSNLALMLRDQGKYEEAESLHWESLAIHKKTLGDNHSSVAIDMNNIARLFQDLGRYAEAENYMRNALKMSKEVLGIRHPNVAIHLSYLASILNDAGRLDEAEVVCREAHNIGKRVFSEMHPRMAYIFRIRAEIDLGKNRLDNAEFYSTKSLEIYKAVHRTTPNHKDIAESLLTLAKILHAKKDETASRTGKECLEMMERAIGLKHPMTIKARMAIEKFSEKY